MHSINDNRYVFSGSFSEKIFPQIGGLESLRPRPKAAAVGLARAQPGPGPGPARAPGPAWPGPGPVRPGPDPGLNRRSKTVKIALNGVQVAPFGLKLCQNDAPDLRIIFPALLDPKPQLKKSKTPKIIKIPIFTVNNAFL